MLAVLISCLLVMSVTSDLMTDRIPNALTLTGLTAGMLCAFARAGPPGLLPVIRDIAFMFIMTFLLFRLRALRGGDGKLLCALSALLGIQTGIRILMYSMLIAAIMGTGMLLWKKYKDPAAFCCTAGSCKSGEHRGTGIHFSVPILLAFLVCFMNRP